MPPRLLCIKGETMKGKIGYDRLVTIIAIIGTALIYSLLVAFGAPCPIKYILGVSCPGCGMTRAAAALLSGDLAMAFHYHPLWLFVAVAVIVLAVALLKRWDRLYKYTLIVGVAVMFAVWAWRLLDPNCDVVTVDLDRGIIGWIYGSITDL